MAEKLRYQCGVLDTTFDVTSYGKHICYAQAWGDFIEIFDSECDGTTTRCENTLSGIKLEIIDYVSWNFDIPRETLKVKVAPKEMQFDIDSID